MLYERLMADPEANPYLDPDAKERYEIERKKGTKKEKPATVPFTERPEIKALNERIEQQKRDEKKNRPD